MEKLRKKFSKIYDDNINRIYRFVYLKVSSKDVAQDLTSEAFLKTWEKFKEGKGKSIENPRAFLYKTARNLIIDHYREKDKKGTFPVEGMPLPDPRQSLEEKAFQDSDLFLIKQSLVNLKEDYQNIIICRYLEDMPIREIAKAFDKSEESVRVMLHRAIKSLKRELS